MSEFAPVRTVQELDLLDEDEILAGYLAGLDGAPEPGIDKSRGFYHGWRNAMTDRGLMPLIDAQIDLARSVCRTDFQ